MWSTQSIPPLNPLPMNRKTLMCKSAEKRGLETLEKQHQEDGQSGYLDRAIIIIIFTFLHKNSFK